MNNYTVPVCKEPPKQHHFLGNQRVATTRAFGEDSIALCLDFMKALTCF